MHVRMLGQAQGGEGDSSDDDGDDNEVSATTTVAGPGASAVAAGKGPKTMSQLGRQVAEVNRNSTLPASTATRVKCKVARSTVCLYNFTKSRKGVWDGGSSLEFHTPNL